ncbi:hypothetical protein N9O45_04665, partial [Planktomarina temperata]|nr:hypothetical protein [Planktomarina temperata]
ITYAAATGGTSPVAGTDDTLNLTVEGMGSATADVSVTAAGVETLAVTSNAAATAAGATNYLDLSGVAAATTTTVTGAADTDIASIAAATTSVDASAVTGAVTLSATNAAAGALTSIKTGSGDDAITIAHGDMSANATIDAGDGTDALTVTGAATNTTIWTVSGVESIDLSGVTGTATMSMKNSDAIADIALGNADGAYAGVLTVVSDSGAKNFDVLGDSTNSLSTDTAGAVDIDVLPDADATATSTETSTVDITAASASSVNIHVSGEVDWAGTTSAAKATSVTLENASGRAQTIDIAAAAAETATITSNAESTTLHANTDLSGAKTVTISTAGAFRDSSTAGLDGANAVTLSGSGSKSAATFDTLVGATDLGYNLAITATGMKAGVTLTNGADAGSGALTFDASGATGAMSTGNLAATSSITVSAGTTGALTTGTMNAKTVTVNAADSLDGASLSTGSNGTATGTADITANTVTINGSELNANSADIVAQADGTAMAVTLNGGIEADLFSVLSTTTVKSVTVSGELDLGADLLHVELANYATKATDTVTVDLSGVTKAAASDTQTDVDIVVAAETDNDMTITGSKGTDDSVDFGADTTLTGRTITLSGVENVEFDDGTAAEAAMISGQEIELTGDAGGAVITLNGTDGADTIDLEDITTSNTSAPTIDAGLGADTITLGALTETVSFADVSAAADADTITDFTVGTDLIGLDLGLTTDGTLAGAAAVVEDEAVAAANVNGAAYDLNAALAASTSTVDLITLDTAVLTNIANADLSAATDGTELLKALVAAGAGNTADALTMGTDGDKVYIAVDDGTDGYLYLVEESTGDVDVEAVAADITLIATFDGTATFGDIAAAQTIMVA